MLGAPEGWGVIEQIPSMRGMDKFLGLMYMQTVLLLTGN